MPLHRFCPASWSRLALAALFGLLLATSGTAADPRPPRSTVGQPRTGHTQKFGNGTITHWSDGTTTRSQPFGSGSLTTETGRDGRPVTGHTQKFGNGTITNWSDGSTTRSEKFGNGTLQREQPGRSRQ
jgi:hypothetical protein